MTIPNWLNRNRTDIETDPIFQKYFDNVPVEEGTDAYFQLNAAKGIDLIMTPALNVKAVHFYSGVQEDINEFTGNLPCNLQFSLSRDKVRSMLSLPSASGGGGFSFLYGTTPFWDKYIFDDYTLHLQFSKNLERVDLITLEGLSTRI